MTHPSKPRHFSQRRDSVSSKDSISSHQDALVRRQQREARIPALHVPDHLPVAAHAQILIDAIRNHPVVIVAGETGSGKTTQLPKLALAAGCGRSGWIGHTQPRRLAARMVASRLAEELASPLGGAGALVGSKIRFSDHSHPNQLIKVMTDGILLMELVRDRSLKQYDTLIIDEAHERSLNIDFLLGYLKQLQRQRKDLKLIITSATLDAERFSSFFNGAPVLTIPGKTYPVEIRYRSPVEQKLDEAEALALAIEECEMEGAGDILVFLPGEREIRENLNYLEARFKSSRLKKQFLPLYSRLNQSAQDRIFHPKGNDLRVILATNVAETSLTVPGIRYVIDTGLARISRYLPRQKVERLQVEPIDQSSARQRAGRCGRTMPGICIRLYSEDDCLNRPLYPDPEVLRTSLAGVILKMSALRLGSVEQFPWLSEPSGRAISEAYQVLQELGALDEQMQCTVLGKALAKLPLEPRLGAMLLAAHDRHVLTEALVILSGQATGDPRERPHDRAQAADQAQKVFLNERSDFLSWLQLWDAIEEHTEGKTRRQQQEWCDRYFLNGRRIHEWQAFFDQLAEQLDTLGWSLNPRHEVLDTTALHQALLIGLLDWVGQWQPEHQSYLGPRGQRFIIHPSSGLKKRKPLWIMTGEQIETTQRFGREVAECDPLWIEKVAAHRLSRQYIEPHWEHKTQQPVAFERVSFGQLVIFARRKVRYAPIDLVASREVLLHDALVGGKLESDLAFWKHHASQLQRLEEWQIRDRSHRALLDDEALYRWYAQRIPEYVYDGRSLKAWYEKLESAEQRALEWPLEAVVWQSDEVQWTQFPDEWRCDGMAFRLRYCFDPKREDDGVSLEVPLAHLNRFTSSALSWNVPGLWREMIAERIKALPKLYRQRFLPPDPWVTRFLEATIPYEEELEIALWAFLRGHVPEWKTQLVSPWERARPTHWMLGIRVLDESGAELGYFRSLDDAKAAFTHQAGQAFQEHIQSVFEMRHTPSWDFPEEEIPAKLYWSDAGFSVYVGDHGSAEHAEHMLVFPALQVEGEAGVALQYFETEFLAHCAHKEAVLHLLRFMLKKELQQQLPVLKSSGWMLAFRSLADVEQWQKALGDMILLRSAWGEDEPLPWKAEAFEQLRQRTRTRLPAVTQSAMRYLQNIAETYARLNGLIASLASSPFKQVVTKRRDQLLPAEWLSVMPWGVWAELPRYLEALCRRIQRFPDQRDRDTRQHQNWESWWNRWQGTAQKWERTGAPIPQELAVFRWQLEECAVSLWAQELKTPYPVSFKRIEKTWEKIKANLE